MLSLIILQLPGFQNKYITLTCLIVYNMFQAISDVVTDAIMVTCARNDPIHGSSDLQILHIVSLWAGGIVGSVVSSYVNEHFHPFVIFRGFWVTSIMFTIFAFCIKEIQLDQNTSAIENVKLSLQHISRGLVLGPLVFLFISGSIIPSFSDITYYWMITVLEFSKRTIALLALIAYCTAFVGTFIYNSWLKNIEYRYIMVLAHAVIAFAWGLSFLQVSRISKEVFGMNDIFFSFVSDAALDILYVAFVVMPTSVVQTKIVPK